MSYERYETYVRIKGDKGEFEIKDTGYEYGSRTSKTVLGLLEKVIEQYNNIEVTP